MHNLLTHWRQADRDERASWVLLVTLSAVLGSFIVQVLALAVARWVMP